MKIGLMICGGTFDSRQEEHGGGRDVDRAFDPRRYDTLIATVAEQLPEVNIQLVVPPTRIDSSQLTPNWIQDLVYVIQRALGDFDELVVAIGTDTLSYVVPAVATALGSIPDKSIAFISGMNPWYVESSDALQNLIDALSLIAKRHHRGVMMVSGRRIYPPYNIAKISHDAIDPFREIKLHKRGKQQQLPQVLQERLGRGESVGKPYGASEKITFSPPVIYRPLTSGDVVKPVVAQFQVFPGLQTDAILRFAGDAINHVIFRCYANGTAPVSGTDLEFSIASAVNILRARRVMCYAVSQHIGAVAPSDYTVCEEMEKEGCLYVTRFTAETLHAILLILSAIIRSPSEVQARIREAEKRLS